MITKQQLVIQLVELMQLACSADVPVRMQARVVAVSRYVSDEEAFADLQRIIKYLVFDLEATRRERDYLRFQLLRREIDGELDP